MTSPVPATAARSVVCPADLHAEIHGALLGLVGEWSSICTIQGSEGPNEKWFATGLAPPVIAPSDFRVRRLAQVQPIVG